MIHHEAVPVEGAAEDAGYDVIENNDGFNVVQYGNALDTFTTLEAATADAYARAEADEKAIAERARAKRREAGQMKRLGRMADELADLIAIQINHCGGKLDAVRYARQALLEEVIQRLAAKV